MTLLQQYVLVFVSGATLALLFMVFLRILSFEKGSKAALHNVQLQLAFIAGRIGLRNQDLQSAAVRAEDTEKAPPPEVIGGDQWNDFEELIERAQRGEVNLEETTRAG
jgi:hypothetical protein